MKLLQKGLMLLVMIGCTSCSNNNASITQAELPGPKVVRADSILCPEGTLPNRESGPGYREAWCEFYSDGGFVPHGPYLYWYADGTLAYKGQHDKGKRNGHWYGWYPSGSMQIEITYEDGQIVSETYWTEDGLETDSLTRSSSE